MTESYSIASKCFQLPIQLKYQKIGRILNRTTCCYRYARLGHNTMSVIITEAGIYISFALAHICTYTITHFL